ncbi:hypothetical protein JCGZ_20885 [Jatropha curcas]|uniref:NB-ARC domain-containing protein n=1 Tax=Jatropha curcas TaxID=180498 RepID=A0A067LH24_JATCU|nr:hypothetical protein JCGZ_20885 [Jatropha curcas]
MYDIEDFIDELIIRSAQRRSREAIIRCILSLVDLPRQFFYVLALIDLTDSYRFYKKLELIKVNISRIFSFFFLSGSWHDTFSPYDLEIGTTIVSPVISKFEALATKRQLRPAVRKQARWLRDEFKSLMVFLKDLESRETLSERGMAWTEELCDVCRSTENVVGLFLTKNEKRNPRSLFWSPRNFISQRNIAQQMARIQVIVSDISERRHEAIDQTTWFWDGYPSITPPATPEQLDIDMVSFEEDVDAVIKQLLKDDPRCLTISIVGVKGIGKTRLVKFIYESQIILDNFPHRNWVAGSSYYEIMEEILSLHNKECPKPVGNENYTDRLKEMVNHLLLDKKCLIVVDGSNASEFWRVMGTAFRDMSNGTRIIFLVDSLSEPPPVTETNSAYRLHLRSNDESWALFTHALKIKIPPELEQNLKKHILRKCNVELSDIYLVGKLKNQDLISKFPQSLTELTLSASGLIDDPMQTLDKLPKLRIVRLFSRSFLGKKMLCKDGGFPKLEVLKLWELELLEEWNMEEGALPNLKNLEIRSCKNLKMLPNALRCIKTLRQVKLTKMPVLSSSLKDKQNEDLNKIAHVRLRCMED